MGNIEYIYIKDLKVDNYKSLKDSKIELKNGLNVIIGKNGAGKSNMLDFIYKYASNRIFMILRRSTRSISTNFSVSIEYKKDNEIHLFSYSIERLKNVEQQSSSLEPNVFYEIIFSKKVDSEDIITNKKFHGSHRDFRQFVNQDEILSKEINIFRSFERGYITYNIPDDSFWVSKPNRITIDEDNDLVIDEMSSFSFFSQLEGQVEFDFLKDISAEIKNDIQLLKERILSYLNSYLEVSNINHYLKNYSPIQEIRFNSNVNIFKAEESLIIENLFIEFLIETDWVPWSFLSDGTKRLFYLISESLDIDEGVILIEEPELGIHPHQFSKILDFLKEQSRTKQVIISTHSPLALDILEEDELDRITIAKYEKGTKFLKLDNDQINKAKKYMNDVGELSYYWLHSDLEK